jgi:thymidylate kinase
MTGKLIVFEGPDGIGKSTLVQVAADFLQAERVPVISISSPGKTPGTLGHLVDRVHHSGNEFQIADITPLALQALHIAAHLDSVERQIVPALKRGVAVLLDRSWWSTWVYGQAAKVNETVLSKLIEAERALWGDVTPSVVVLVQRTIAFRAEHSQETFDILSTLYENLARSEEQHHPIIRISNDDLQLSTNRVREELASIVRFRSTND